MAETDKAEAEVKARLDWLGSPTAKAQRVVSRMAFHGLGSDAARSLVRRDFASQLHGANPASTAYNGGTVIRYLGSSRAIVRTPAHETETVTSTVPLVASRTGGAKRPIDLTLRPDGSVFAPVNPLEPVSIAQSSDRGTSVGSEGITFTPIGRGARGEPSGGAVFFHGVAPDEDALVTPTVRGAEFSAILRSRLSPERLRYRVDLPHGARLIERAGAAAVVRGGQLLASIPAPSAFDAQKTLVPVLMHVSGDELVLDVPHRSLDIAYPVLVDPKLWTYVVARATPGWEFSAEHASGHPSIDGVEPGVLTAPKANWGVGEVPETAPTLAQHCKELEEEGLHVVECNWVHEEPWLTPQSTWQWQAPPGGPVSRTTYEGLAITPPVANEGATTGTGELIYGVCGEESSNLESAPPETVTCTNRTPTMSLKVVSPPRKEVWWPEEHLNSLVVAETSVATTFSIEAMTVVQSRLSHRRRGPRKSELLGSSNPGEPNRIEPCEGDPVNCATGNLTETQTDFAIPGRGVGLDLTRTYNAQAADAEERPGPFGYGWSWSFGAQISFGEISSGGVRTRTQAVKQGNGSTVVFSTTEGHTTTAPGVQATLEQPGSDYLFKLPDQTLLTFYGSGELASESDRNGNTTTVEEVCEGGGGGGVAQVRMLYADYRRMDVSGGGGGGCQIVVTDPSGRKLTLYLNADGLVERATDPMGHTVSYEYEDGDLTAVTYPGESSPAWRFRYDSQHRMVESIDGRGAKTTNTYDSASRVTAQTDRRGDTRHFAYEELDAPLEGALIAPLETHEEEELPELTEAEEAGVFAVMGVEAGEPPAPPGYATKISDEANGAVTVEHFDVEDEPTSITRGSGTTSESTESFEYSLGAPTSVTDGNGHKTNYTYDPSGNRTSRTDPDGDKAEWEYDDKHDVIASTTPNGEHTTVERDSHGNALKVSRPAPGGTQVTEYAYDSYGELTSMTDPLEHVWKYEYDSAGDQVAQIDPEGNKRTFTFDADSREISTTSPRGNAPGAEAGRYTTIIERDGRGRVVRVIEPLQ